jgi:hypothetical protein
MAFGNEQAKSIDPKNPQAGSAKLASDLKTKVSGKQENKTEPMALTNDDAKAALGLEYSKYSGIA